MPGKKPSKTVKNSSKKTTGLKATAFKPKIPTVKDPLTKGGIIKAIMDVTGVAKKDTTSVLDALNTIIELHVKSRGPRKFTLPGLLKINVVKTAAKPARKGVNPFTGEEQMFKAKPAGIKIKIRPLRRLKEMAL
ncbi:MAG: HU family DNA-binding protein [Gammaproteobacteria bacterium]|nr:HU family DNA-binding protein [Gammaproteobacteria bacterium]